MELSQIGDLDHACIFNKRNKLKFPERVLRKWMGQMVSAMIFMQKQGILHTNLKPSNVLLFGNIENIEEQWVKISDFGLNKYVNRNRYYKGSNNYQAPELRNNRNKHSSASDIWSLCMIMVRLILTELP